MITTIVRFTVHSLIALVAALVMVLGSAERLEANVNGTGSGISAGLAGIGLALLFLVFYVGAMVLTPQTRRL